MHDGFVDGSGWQTVHDLLTKDGYRVAVVQHPTLSLEDDVAVARRVIDELDGPVVLVGHSYGGAVITEAGLHDKVAALVYITAFAPDKGESVNTLIADPPPGARLAGHVRTGRLNRDRSPRQPLQLPVSARRGSRPHHPGR